MDQNLIDKKVSDIKNARIFIDEQYFTKLRDTFNNKGLNAHSMSLMCLDINIENPTMGLINFLLVNSNMRFHFMVTHYKITSTEAVLKIGPVHCGYSDYIYPLRENVIKIYNLLEEPEETTDWIQLPELIHCTGVLKVSQFCSCYTEKTHINFSQASEGTPVS